METGWDQTGPDAGKGSRVALLLPAKRIDCSSRRVRERQTARPAVVQQPQWVVQWLRWLRLGDRRQAGPRRTPSGLKLELHFGASHEQVNIIEHQASSNGRARIRMPSHLSSLACWQQPCLPPTLHRTKTEPRQDARRRGRSSPHGQLGTLFCLTPCWRGSGWLLAAASCPASESRLVLAAWSSSCRCAQMALTLGWLARGWMVTICPRRPPHVLARLGIVVWLPL